MAYTMIFGSPEGKNIEPKKKLNKLLLYNSIFAVAVAILASGAVFVYNKYRHIGEEQSANVNSEQKQLDELNRLREEAKKQTLTPEEQAAQLKERNKIRQQQIKIPPLTAKEIQLQIDESNRLREEAKLSK